MPKIIKCQKCGKKIKGTNQQSFSQIAEENDFIKAGKYFNCKKCETKKKATFFDGIKNSGQNIKKRSEKI